MCDGGGKEVFETRDGLDFDVSIAKKASVELQGRRETFSENLKRGPQKKEQRMEKRRETIRCSNETQTIGFESD